jgi:U3 small nucleolar RNA-associated protein 21
MKIYSFDPTKLLPSSRSTHPQISALVQSPAIDVIAIGFSSGELSIYDIKLDERLFGINMRIAAAGASDNDVGRISAIGFRAGKLV